MNKKSLQEKIEALGGKVGKEVSAKTAALITTKEVVEKKAKSKALKDAIKHKIQVTSLWNAQLVLVTLLLQLFQISTNLISHKLLWL